MEISEEQIDATRTATWRNENLRAAVSFENIITDTDYG
jgi:hypothetical protein